LEIVVGLLSPYIIKKLNLEDILNIGKLQL
jgi:hypothetical protein